MLSKYLLAMELRFDLILYSKLVTKILMRAISNDHAGPIKREGRRFLTPDLKSGCLL